MELADQFENLCPSVYTVCQLKSAFGLCISEKPLWLAYMASPLGHLGWCTCAHRSSAADMPSFATVKSYFQCQLEVTCYQIRRVVFYVQLAWVPKPVLENRESGLLHLFLGRYLLEKFPLKSVGRLLNLAWIDFWHQFPLKVYVYVNTD